MTVYLVKFLPKYHVYRIYVVSANPTHASREGFTSVLINRVGQNRIYTPYMTVCMVISLPKIKFRIYTVYTYKCMVLANPMYVCLCQIPGGGGGRISRCVLIDREVDLITPMMSQITFEGLIDEVIGIRAGGVPWTPKGETSEPAVRSAIPAKSFAPMQKIHLSIQDS
jgi:hypothetical protein